MTQKSQYRRRTRATEDEDSEERDGVTTEISNSTTKSVNSTQNLANAKNCVVQCVLQRIGMVDMKHAHIIL